MLPPNLFSLPAATEVIAPGEVLRRRNEVLTTVLHLESGRVLRGVLDDGVRVQKGMKSGDVDPRGKAEYCTTVSDKALAVGGGVVEAVLYLRAKAQGRR